MTGSDLAQWTVRYRAGRPVLPRYAATRPDRCVLSVRTTGKPEVIAWDQGTGLQRQVTDQPHGTSRYAIDAAGEWVWWFADPSGRGVGSWWREPFEGGPAVAVTPPNLGPAGLAFSRDGFAVGAFMDGRTRIWCRAADWAFAADRSVVSLTMDGHLLALSEVGPAGPRRPTVIVLRTDDGTEIARLAEYGGRAVHAIAFSPSDSRLLLLHEAHGSTRPLIWDPRTGDATEPDLPLDGELRAEWATDGAALLLCELSGGGSRLLHHRLDSATTEEITTGHGFVHDATSRPGGVVEYLRSSTVEPPEVRSTAGAVLLRADVGPVAAEVSHEQVGGPGGPVPTLVSRPRNRAGPLPAVFLLHGGPAMHDTDSFNPYVATWVEHGYGVVRVNYRGSTGFGHEWREPAGYRPGLTELDDVDTVREWAVDAGIADPSRMVIAGSSWGGYLGLLAVGRSPHAWSLCIAEAPIADFAAAYEKETERLRALDRSIFGGSPQECPDRYRESSPITYVDQVVAPVLLTVGANDPRCPADQVRRYADRLRSRGADVVLDEHPAGHGSRDINERIAQVQRQLDFVTSRLSARSGAVLGGSKGDAAWPRS